MASIKLGQKFSSYADLEAAVDRFSEETYTLFTKTESKKLEQYKDMYRRIRLAPKELVYYLITYRCIAWGKLKRRNTARVRKSSGTFRQGCEAKMTVCLSQDAQHLEVTLIKMDHNHAVSKELYESLPRVRLKLPKPLIDKIRRDLDENVRKDYLIEKIFEETGKRLTFHDLNNIHYPWKKSKKNLQESATESEKEKNKKKVSMKCFSELADIALSENLTGEEQVPFENQPEIPFGFESASSTFACFNSPGGQEMQHGAPNAESAFERTESFNSSGLIEAQSEAQSNPSAIQENVLKIPSAILVYCNEPIKGNNISKAPFINSQKEPDNQIQGGTLKELIETQRETNIEIKRMNKNLSDIVQVLKRIESKLSSNANIV